VIVRSSTPRGRERRSRLARYLVAASAALILLGSLLPAAQASHAGGSPTTVHVLTAGNNGDINVNGRKDAEYVLIGVLKENGTSTNPTAADLFALYVEGNTGTCAAGQLFVYIKMKTPALRVRTLDDPSGLVMRYDADGAGGSAEATLAFAGAGPVYHPQRTGVEFSVCYTTVDAPGEGIAVSFLFTDSALVGSGRLALFEDATTTTDVGLTIATPDQPPPPPPSGTLQLPATPIRIMDTRIDVGLSGTFRGNIYRTLDVTSSASIPDDAFAITGNIAVVSPTHAGYVSVLHEEIDPPPISTVNFKAGEVRPNNFVARLAADGTVSIVYLATAAARAELVLDETGFFVTATNQGHYVGMDPLRLVDSRDNTGVTGAFTHASPKTFQVRGIGDIPNNVNVVAVAGNLAVTGANKPGFAALTTTSNASPATSTLNFVAGETVANGIVIGLSNTGTLSAVVRSAAGGQAHLVFDVTGYFVQGASGTIFHTVDPGRQLDTRIGTGLSGKFVAGTSRTLTVSPATPVPAGAVGVTGNLTVVNQQLAGFVSATEPLNSDPGTSTINFKVGQVIGNGLVAPLTGGEMGLIYKAGASSSATTDLVFDATGYFE
jgi:hypothetical protein